MSKRVIKFRIWDGVAMYDSSAHPDFTLCDFADMTNPVNKEWMEENEPDFERYHLMQFTGLLDKNGKEIYEGDIVEAKNWNPMRYAVKFIEGGFCFTHPKMKGSPIDINLMFSSQGCACAVIGNIHEHKHLLP